MPVFKEAVEYKINDPCDRFVRFLKFTEGEAKDTIKHCIQQSLAVGYQRAKLLLEQHYGDPHHILYALRNEIKSWPILKPGVSVAYQKLYNFLIKYESIMLCQQQNFLDTPDVLVTSTLKLSGDVRDG